MRGHVREQGSFCIFKCLSLLLIFDFVMGFEFNLNAFVGILLNKSAYETVNHNSPDIFYVINGDRL